MRPIPLPATALAVLAALAVPAVAQTPAQTPAETPAGPAPAAERGEPPVRYTMQAVNGGLMKLDTRTGRLSFCSARTGSWACELVPEERNAYEDEIGRLNERIATLQKPDAGSATAHNNVPPGVPDIIKPAPPATPDAGQSSTAPKAPDAGEPTGEGDGAVRRHLDQAMDTAEYVFRRFLDMVARLKSEEEKL